MLTAKEMIAALERSKGHVANAAKYLKVSRTTFYRYLNKYPTVREKLHDLREATKDWVESKLLQKIDIGDTTSIIFYLKTQARDRGYGDKRDIDLNIGEIDHAIEQQLARLGLSIKGTVTQSAQSDQD